VEITLHFWNVEGNLGQDSYWKGNYYILLECGRPFGSIFFMEITLYSRSVKEFPPRILA
jgi:hypothetical protein